MGGDIPKITAIIRLMHASVVELFRQLPVHQQY